MSRLLLSGLSILTALFSIKAVGNLSFAVAFPSNSHDVYSSSSSSSLPSRIRLRNGFPDDEIPISLTMARELMNPLAISHKNTLVVAEDTKTGERVGWAQIRPIGYATLVAGDPSRFEDGEAEGNALSLGNVQSTDSIEEDVDEVMWQEFEDDPTDFPNGFASLPWTKEYRAASQAAADRLQRREKILKAELDARPKLWELSSVYVNPRWRREGIGSLLVKQVMKQHVTTKQPGRDVYALTLTKMAHWYAKFGFIKEKQIPDAMAMEMSVGNVITTMTGAKLVCLRTTL